MPAFHSRHLLDLGNLVEIVFDAHQELGMDVLVRVKDDLDEIAKVEQMPRMEGRQMTMVVAPK